MDHFLYIVNRWMISAKNIGIKQNLGYFPFIRFFLKVWSFFLKLESIVTPIKVRYDSVIYSHS